MTTAQVALTAKSSNRKTGAIPTTTSSKETCPDTCAFKEKGCYAKGGPQNIHWQAVTDRKRGGDWDTLTAAIRKLAKGQLWRHNVSGDLPHVEGIIDRVAVMALALANKGKRGFTYTHHALNAENVETLKLAKENGFTVNISTEDVNVADAMMTAYDLPAVAVVPSSETRRSWQTDTGRTVLRCPATVADHMTCERCGLCQVADRQYVIAFPAHGNAKKTVDSLVTV